MIALYSPEETDFTGHGLGLLQPVSATVHEIAGGSYEAEVVLPMLLEQDGLTTPLWRSVTEGSLMRIPTPSNAAPAVELYGSGSVWTTNATVVVRSRPDSSSKQRTRLKSGVTVQVLRTVSGGSSTEPIKANYQDYTLTSRRTKSASGTYGSWSTMTGEITFNFKVPSGATGITATYTGTVKKAAAGQRFTIGTSASSGTEFKVSKGDFSYTLPSGAISAGATSVTLYVNYTATVKSGEKTVSCKEFDQNLLTITCSGGESWSQIVTADGTTGWVLTSNLTSGGSANAGVISTTQLFRAYETVKDTANRTLTVRLRHKSYDHTGSILNRLKVKRTQANTVLSQIQSGIMGDDEEFSIGTNLTRKITADYSYMPVIQALLDPEKGIVRKCKARVYRDNDTIYLLQKNAPDRGYRIRYGKNLKGVTWTVSDDNVITRVVPLGKNKDGEQITLKDIEPDDNPWIGVDDSSVPESESDYPVPKYATITVDDAVEVEEEKDADGNVTTPGFSLEECYELMRDAAWEEFETNGCHLLRFDLEVDFLDLGNTVEYAQYKNLYDLHLYDLVQISHGPYGMVTSGQVAEYEYDAIAGCYTRIVIGDVYAVQGSTVAGWQIAAGTIGGTQIAAGAITGGHIAELSIGNAQIGNASIDNAKIGNAAITYAKIDTATIDNLTAGVIDAVEAHIEHLVAGKIEADDIETRIVTAVEAHIGTVLADEVDTDTLNATIAQLIHAEVEELEAEDITVENIAAIAASVVSAQIGTLEMDSATADQIKTNLLSAVNADLDNIHAFDIDAGNLSVGIAEIADARIGTATIDWAQIETLVGETIINARFLGDVMYIDRLAVTSAQMVDLTVGQLCVMASDGNYYTLDVDIESGSVTATQTTVTDAEITAGETSSGKHIIETSLTAQDLYASTAALQEALINKLMAARIDVDQLFAREAFINQLNTTDISGNQYLRLAVHEELGLRVEIQSTRDVLSEEHPSATLTAKVYSGDNDVTGDYDASAFSWTRTSDYPSADAIWNTNHTGMKSVSVSTDDVYYNAVYAVTVAEE